MADKNKIGVKIRNIMELRQLSVEELANNSAVNPELVEKILDGEIIPSLTPLTRMARALGVRLGTFLDDDPKDDPIIIRKGKSEEIVYFSGEENKTEDTSLQFYSLGAGKSDRHMEPFVIDMQRDEEEHDLSSHEGEEFIYILEGEVELIYGQNTYLLYPGDSLYYDSIIPHHTHAHTENAKILAVLYTPF